MSFATLARAVRRQASNPTIRVETCSTFTAAAIDLVFPHHENEIAQSCSAFHSRAMANVWMHNGFLQVEGEKMAKSAGNFVTIHELLQTTKFGNSTWPGEVLRLAMLRTHYRDPIDWTVRELERAHGDLGEWYGLIGADASFNEAIDPGVLEALFDDLNTHGALKRLHELAEEKKIGVLSASLKFLGFSCDRNKLARRIAANFRAQSTATATFAGKVTVQTRASEAPDRAIFHIGPDGITTDELTQKRIDELIAQRRNARAAKNWPESDRLRDELSDLGVAIKDNKDGTTSWEPKR